MYIHTHVCVLQISKECHYVGELGDLWNESQPTVGQIPAKCTCMHTYGTGRFVVCTAPAHVDLVPDLIMCVKIYDN